MEEKKSPASAAESATSGQPAAVPAAELRPGRRKFPTVGDLFAMLGIALGAQALVGLFGLLFSLFAGHGANYNTMEPAALGRLVAALYFVSMAVALGGLLYYRRVRGGRGRWARFSTRGLNPALLLWAFVMMCAVGVVLEPLLALLPELQINVGRGFWTILSLVLFAPVFEELICRGVVLGSLRSRYGVTIAWLVSSLFFGILHGQPVQVINATVIGLVLGYVYLATDSLWSVMILHALNNAVAYLMLVTGHANTLLIDLIPGRTLYVAVYVVALAALLAFSLPLPLLAPSARSTLAALGAVTFVVSDMTLCHNLLLKRPSSCHFVSLGIYYMAQRLLALSAFPPP